MGNFSSVLPLVGSFGHFPRVPLTQKPRRVEGRIAHCSILRRSDTFPPSTHALPPFLLTQLHCFNECSKFFTGRKCWFAWVCGSNRLCCNYTSRKKEYQDISTAKTNDDCIRALGHRQNDKDRQAAAHGSMLVVIIVVAHTRHHQRFRPFFWQPRSHCRTKEALRKQQIQQDLDRKKGRGWTDPWDIDEMMDSDEKFEAVPDWAPHVVSRISQERVQMCQPDKIP